MSTDPTAAAPTVLVTAVGRAEGSKAAAAALACAGADIDRATLLIDIGGRAPRPTLLASAAARQLEERLVAHLPQARVAARGQTCHIAVPADVEGFETAAAAGTVGRDALGVLHAPAASVPALLVDPVGARLTAALLRANVRVDRPLLALAVRDLMDRGLRVAVLKRELAWVASRRALFGALPADAAAGLPATLLQKLAVEHACYAGLDDAETDSARASERQRRNHAGVGSR